MALLTSALAATVLLSAGNRSLAVDAQVDSEGLTVAEKFLESAQAAARKDFRLVNPTTTLETIGPLTYTKKLEVGPMSDFFTKTVTTTVSWPGTYGRTQHISLTSLVTNFENVIGGDTCYSPLVNSQGAPSAKWETPSQLQVTPPITLGSVSGIDDPSGAYPISDMEVYQQKMYIAVGSSAQNTSMTMGTAAINKNTTGTAAWSGATGALASGGSSATVSLTGNATSNYLWVTGFGTNFSIPNGATILGIQVDVMRSPSNSSAIVDNGVRLIKADGTLAADNKAKTTTWGSGNTQVTYGGPADFWGDLSWSAAAIKNSGFGVAFSAKNTSSQTRTANVDYIGVTITYTKQFYALNLATPTNPSFVGPLATSTISQAFNAIASDGKYAYVATASTTKQLAVISVSGSQPSEVKDFGLSGGAVGNAVFYKDGYLYLGLANSSGPEFTIIDVHNPLNIPATPTGTYEVGAGINSIFVRGNYAYLATDNNTQEYIVLSLADLLHPQFVGAYNAPGNNTTGNTWGLGKSLYTVGDTLYAGRNWTNSGSTPQLVVLDTSAATPAAVGSGKTLGTNMSLRGIVVRDYLAFLLTGSDTQGGNLQIANVRDPLNIPATASIPLQSGGKGGAALDCEGNYLYAASTDAANKGYLTVITAI